MTYEAKINSHYVTATTLVFLIIVHVRLLIFKIFQPKMKLFSSKNTNKSLFFKHFLIDSVFLDSIQYYKQQAPTRNVFIINENFAAVSSKRF